MQPGWRTAKSIDRKKGPKGFGKGGGHRYLLDETFVRVHFSEPEEMYEHPDDPDVKLWYYTGERYYVPHVGENGKYFHTDGNTVIDAWRDPEKFNLDLKPLEKLQDPNVKPAQLFYAVSGWIEEWFHVVEEKNRRTGTAYKVRELCTGPGCELCESGAA